MTFKKSHSIILELYERSDFFSQCKQKKRVRTQTRFARKKNATFLLVFWQCRTFCTIVFSAELCHSSLRLCCINTNNRFSEDSPSRRWQSPSTNTAAEGTHVQFQGDWERKRERRRRSFFLANIFDKSGHGLELSAGRLLRQSWGRGLLLTCLSGHSKASEESNHQMLKSVWSCIVVNQ